MAESKLLKAGYIAFIGRPNVGKSTLFNALLKQKTAIVTPKPQTTRNRILGIMNGDDYQIICLDTPGLIEPSNPLQKSLLKTSLKTIYDADLVFAIISAEEQNRYDSMVFDYIQKEGTPSLLIINKIDLVKKEVLLPLMDKMYKLQIFDEIVPISALRQEGIDELISIAKEKLPPGHPFYPPDIISSEPERFFVSEIIREQIFLQFTDEIPYATAVSISQFKERPGKKDLISAVITVERESQKRIIIGKNGKSIKKLGMKAREEIEKFLDRPVFLELFIQVRKGWRKNPVKLKELGY